MKIQFQNSIKKKEPNRASETALMGWSQPPELLELRREDGGLFRSLSSSYWSDHELPQQAGRQQSQWECQQERSEIVKRIRPDSFLLFLECETVLFGQHGSSALEILPRLVHIDLSFVDLGGHRSDLSHA